MCDLTVTQLLLEEQLMEEQVRGIVNGVHNSLDKFTDLVRFEHVTILNSGLFSLTGMLRQNEVKI